MPAASLPVAELVDDSRELPVARPVARPSFARRVWNGFATAVEWCFGVPALFVGLAILASVPVGQFLALGYLLEVSGRVARTGRLRDGFIGVRTAARFGGAALAVGVMWLPLYYVSLQVEAAKVIEPNGTVAKQWERALAVFAVLAVLHATAALLRGGRVRDFARPLNVVWLVRRALRGGLYTEARDRFWNQLVALRLPYYFWLGVRGFAGAFVWLAVPLSLLAVGHLNPAAGLLGGALLAVVVLYVPFLQARFARDDRFRAFREVSQVRDAFRGAPVAFALALWVHLTFAIPLYLLKIEAIPKDIVFLEGLLFLLFIFPARVLGGWALARGARRETPRHWLFRWAARFALVPVALAYVLVVFVSQHIGWQGVGSLYEQHAFLLPVPFVGFK
jgi:hypothetical protein